jgi:hypothetical protein
MRDSIRLLLMNLKEMLPPESMFFQPKEECLQELRRISNRDFGFDVDAWSEWLKAYEASVSARIEAKIASEKGRASQREQDLSEEE